MDKTALKRAVAGALRSTIAAHGPVTAELIGSATKRIVGQIEAPTPPLPRGTAQEHIMSTTTTIDITYTNGETASLPGSTPIYVESWERANSARDDDGSMASIEDLLPAGTLASPDYYVGGVDVEEATWYVEDLGTGDERICVAIAAIEDTTDTIDAAIEAHIDQCSGTREEILGAIAAQGFCPGCPEIEALSADDRAEAFRRVEESC